MNTMTNQNSTMQNVGGVAVQTPDVDLSKKAICLKLSFGTFGNTKKVSNSQIEIKGVDGTADSTVKKSRIRASKHLLESPELESVKKFQREITKYIDALTLPFDVGVDMVPFVIVPDIDKKLSEWAVKHEELVNIFVTAYPEACKQAAKDLGSTYRPQDYAPVEEVAKQFKFFWRWISFGVPHQLEEISPELWKAESAKAQEAMQQAAAEMQSVLRESFSELVAHMAERLKFDETTGKPLKFHESTVSNLMEFLENFSFRNLTDDSLLQEQVDKAKQLLKGTSLHRLKKNAMVRNSVQKGMAAIAKQLDTLMLPAGTRKFRLDD